MGVADIGSWFPAVLALRLVGVALALALARRPAACRAAGFTMAAGASLLSGALAVGVLGSGQAVSGVLLGHEATGLTLGYTVDALSAWFLLVLAALGAPIAAYSTGYLAHAIAPARTAFVCAAFNVLMGALECVFAADNVVGFLFAWELMTLTTAALVTTQHEKRSNRRAAFLYLVLSHVGTGLLMAAFFTLVSVHGSLAFRDLLGSRARPGQVPQLVFGLFLLGFGVKAGVIPLHVWLPEAHPAAPSNISALMSGVMIKTGIYGLFRFCAFGLGLPELAWGIVVLGLGAVSMVLGVLYALTEHDLKRLLAYHSIENIGIILLGLGVGMLAASSGHPGIAALGLAGALFHTLNHALFKGLLFLGAGAVVAAAGTRHMGHLGGLARSMPWTAACFVTGAAAISGLPFLNGFASEWLVFQSLLRGFQASTETFARIAFPLAGALLALTSGLAAACFVKAVGIVFLALPRSAAAAQAREAGPAMLLPQAFLAAACVALGVFPGVVLGPLGRVTGLLLGPGAARAATRFAPAAGAFDWLNVPLLLAAALPALLLAAMLGRGRAAPRRAPTWGCGGVLAPGNEYTATAFAKPLMMIFSSIYRPSREVSTVASTPYFSDEVRYRGQVEPTFERFIYEPLTRLVMAVAGRLRVLQAGSLHAYLAYVLALVLFLVILTWWRA